MMRGLLIFGLMLLAAWGMCEVAWALMVYVQLPY